MSSFGKRTMNTGHGGPRQRACDAPRQSPPPAADLISKSDLKALEKGEIPAWTNTGPMQFIALALVAAAFALGVMAYYGPEVVRDLRYAGTYVEASDLRATDGNCKRYAFLVTACSAKIHSVRDDRPATHTLFLMLFRSGDGEHLVPVRSSVDASAVGVQYAVSNVLLNRVLALFGITLLASGIAWGVLAGVLKGRYKGGPAHAALLHYVALHSSPA